MSSYNVPGPDQAANAKFQTLRAGAVTYSTELNLDVAQIDEIIAAATDFDAKLGAAEAAKDAARGAVAAKDDARTSTTEVMRRYAQLFKNVPGVTPEILAECGITPSVTPVGPVVAVADVTATAYSNGTSEIKWDRNGNVSSTNFVIQYRLAEMGGWMYLASTTKSRFVDSNAEAGVLKMYRVLSQRGGVTSAPSNEAVIYGDGLEETLLAAA